MFWQVIREYYDQYKLNVASTDDFRKVVELVSKRNFSQFFDQWLYKAGQPCLELSDKIADQSVTVKITQTQTPTIFQFPIDIELTFVDSSKTVETVNVTKKSESFTIATEKKATALRYDPNVWLLYEANK